MSTLEQISVEDLENEVATIAARVTALTGRALVILAELERRGAWAGQGFTSLAHWLEWRTGMAKGAAREHVRVAVALAQLPAATKAICDGQLSYSKARAITRIARPETEATLVEYARYATAAQLERICRGVRRYDPKAERAQADRVENRRGVEAFFDDDGMLVVKARLAPDEGAAFLRSLEAARRDVRAETRVEAHTERADALVLMAERALSGEQRSGGDRTQVVVHVDAELLTDPTIDGRSELDGGPGISAETSRRLACDASVVLIKNGESGRKSRVLSAALRRALAARDGGRCTFPACGRRVVDAHHVKHWADGGPTELGNLLTMCRTHHRLVHEGGWRVELAASSPRFVRPDGRPLLAAPPSLPARRSDPPVDASALLCRGDGQRIDYGRAIDGILMRQ